MKRQQFLKHFALFAITPAVAPLLLDSCAHSEFSMHAPSEGGWVSLPASSLPSPDNQYGYIRVYVDDSPNPVFLFRSSGNRIAAVSGTCTHNGCAVKKLRDRFECPCHGSEYALDGSVSKGPAPESLTTYAVTVTRDFIRFQIGGD